MRQTEAECCTISATHSPQAEFILLKVQPGVSAVLLQVYGYGASLDYGSLSQEPEAPRLRHHSAIAASIVLSQ